MGGSISVEFSLGFSKEWDVYVSVQVKMDGTVGVQAVVKRWTLGYSPYPHEMRKALYTSEA